MKHASDVYAKLADVDDIDESVDDELGSFKPGDRGITLEENFKILEER